MHNIWRQLQSREYLSVNSKPPPFGRHGRTVVSCFAHNRRAGICMPQSAAVSAALAARLRGRGGARGVAPPRLGSRAAFRGQPVPVGVPLLQPPVPRALLVDVVGEHSSGKTALLLHIAAHALAPKPVGPSVDVVWIDLNGALDARMLKRSLQSLCPEGTDRLLFFEDCFSRLHVYSPHSSLSMLCTLHSLFEFLQSPLGATGESPSKTPNGALRVGFSCVVRCSHVHLLA
jgi:hypothetical protein